MMKSEFSFVSSVRFFPLFCTQFLGAFNDNFFKTITFVLITYHGLTAGLLKPEQWLNVGIFLFILPYFLFSSLAGELCSRFDKSNIARWVKSAEIAIMFLALMGFLANNLLILFICLFLMGTHSTLFGPVKYAILPQYLPNNRELILGNGLVEAATFVAILLGQFCASALTGAVPIVYIGMIALTIAILGRACSAYMPSVAASTPDSPINWNIVRGSATLIGESYRRKHIWTAIIGISWFWLLGSVYTTQLPVFTVRHLGGNQQVFNLMLTLFSIGIGAGSMICARVSHRYLSLKPVLFGAVGMTIFGIALAILAFHSVHGDLIGVREFLSDARHWAIVLCIGALGFCGGFFSVPLYTWLQLESGELFRAHAVAANNMINGVFMSVAAIISALLISVFDSISLLYLLVAVGNPLLIMYLIRRAPHMWHGTSL